MHEIFISYSRANTAVVDEIATALTSAGAPIWLDRRDIPVSFPWFEEVRGAISGSSLVAVCETLEWYGSEACRLELMATRQYGKRIVYVDPAQGTESAAARILTAYRATTDVQRTHSELLRRSADWDRADRPRNALATGRLLRRLRQVVRAEDLALTPQARDYIVAARRRDRRRRTLAAIGASVLALSLTTLRVVDEVQKRAQSMIAQENTNLIGSAAARRKLESDVYAALSESSAQVQQGKRSYLLRERLMDALNVPVPDRSAVPSASGVSGFTAQLVAAAPTVVDGRGRPVTVTPSSAAAVPPRRESTATTVSDDAGKVTLTVVRHRVTMLAGRRAVTPPCRTGRVATVAPDGRSAATADGTTICSWRPGAPGSTVTRLPGTARITALATYADGLAAGTADGRIYLVARGRAPRRAAGGGAGAVSWLVSAHQGNLVAAGHAGSGVVDVLRPRTGLLYRRMATSGRDHAAAFSPDDRVLAVGSGSTIQLFGMPNGLSRVTLNGSAGEIHAIAWSRDGTRVWAISGHARVSSWLRRPGNVLASDPSKWFIGLTGPDAQGRGFAATQAGELDTVDLNHGTLLGRVRTSASRVVTLAAAPSGELAALGMDGKVLIRDTRTGAERTLTYPGCYVTTLAFALGPHRLYVGCLNAGVRLIDLDGGRTLRTVSLPDDAAASIAPTSDGVFIGGQAGQVFAGRADLTGLKPIYATHQGLTLRSLAPTPSADTVVVGGDGVEGHGGSFRLTREGGKWKAHALLYPDADADQSRALVLSPRTGLAAVGFSDGTVRMLDPVRALPGWVWTDPLGGVRGLAFSQDGTRLTVATRDGMLETIPACPSCESIVTLADVARQRLATARRLGLTRE